MAGCCGGPLGSPLGLSYHTPYGPLGDAPPAGVNLPPNMAVPPAAPPAGGVVPEDAPAPKKSSVSPGAFFLLLGGLGAAYMALKRG
jgi:hypothetical protein